MYFTVLSKREYYQRSPDGEQGEPGPNLLQDHRRWGDPEDRQTAAKRVRRTRTNRHITSQFRITGLQNVSLMS